MRYSVRACLKRQRGASVCPVILRVSWAGERLDVAAGESWESSRWDVGRGRARGEGSGALNRRIAARIAEVDGILSGLVDPPSPTAMRSLLARPGCVACVTVSEAWRRYMAECGQGWAVSTERNTAVVGRQWCALVGGRAVSSVCRADLERFRESMACGTSRTVLKKLSTLRGFLRWCVRAGLLKEVPDYQPRVRGASVAEVVYLTEEELSSFMAHDFGKASRLSNVRDVFCFCCLTGLRWSDVARLSVDDLDLRAEPPVMRVVTTKTSDALTIELSKPALSLLARHKGRADGRALPASSNQKTNKYLHEAARLAGMDAPTRTVVYRGAERCEQVSPKWEVLTFHAARRTFVVTALRLGIPAEVIMSWTGHKNYAAMRPYVKIVGERKAESMRLFDHLACPELFPENGRK